MDNSAVDQMLIPKLPSLGILHQRPWRYDIRAGQESVKIHRGIAHADELIAEITARAGLTESDTSWWGTRYRKPLDRILDGELS